MRRATEIELAKELLGLHAQKSAFLNDAATTSPVEAYLDPDRFRLERDRIMRTTPQPTVHSSELPEPGSFLRRDFAGLPVLFTRDADGNAHAFLNVCRHRGTRLVVSRARTMRGRSVTGVSCSEYPMRSRAFPKSIAASWG